MLVFLLGSVFSNTNEICDGLRQFNSFNVKKEIHHGIA